jgi:RNA polymerase sigma factor (sigma-70 family)
MRLSPDQTEDAIQEVWLAALKNLHRFRGENAARRLHGWMRKVMRCKAVDARHRMHCHRTLPLDTLPAEPMEAKDTGIDRERSTWLAARLDEATKQESLNCRLLCAHFQDGRTIADLAAEAGLTKKAIECRIYRWISKLRQAAAVDGLPVAVALKRRRSRL